MIGADKKIEQIETMRGEIEEKPAAADLPDRRASSAASLPVSSGAVTWTCTEVTLPIAPSPKSVANRQKPRQRAPVIGHPQGQRCARGTLRPSADTRRGSSAIGFSTRHGLPAAATRRARSQWLEGGVAM